MKTIIKFCIFVFVIFSFTACFPVMMTHGEGGHGRYYYNNRNYDNGREYRHARREGGHVEVRVESGDHDRR